MKRLLIIAATAAITLTANAAFAQAKPTGSAASSAAPASEIAEVIITGTRRVNRTVTDSASPIDIISSTDITAQPTANMLDTVKNLVPSVFVGQNSISDASTFVRTLSLRGLPADEVLVMLNGKRFNRSALVQVYNGGDTGLSFGSHGSDISSIPSIAIKRLEVLRDGATAQYGSDAIAGVLNYGLRDDTGFELVARYGQYQDHGDGKSNQIAANYGVKFGNAFVNLSGEYDDDAQTSRGVTRLVAVAFAQENPALASQLPHWPLPAQIWGNSPSHGFKFMLNSGLDVSDKSKIYLFANVANNHADESFNFRSSLQGTRPFTDASGVIHNIGGRSFLQNTNPYYLTQCPASTPTCPVGGYVKDTNTFLMTSIYPAGFTPRFVGVTSQAYGTVGYKGATGSGLRYDLSGTQSRNSLDLSMYNSISPSYGQSTQRSFKFGKLIQSETDANLDLSYDIDAGLASPLTLSGGAEFRRETYEATQGDLQSYGSGPYAAPHNLYAETAPGSGVYAPTGTQTAVYDPAASGYGGTSPTYAGKHSQSSRAIYLDSEADLTSRLSGGVAGRFEHYESFGNASVFKLNGLYKITDGVSFRATVGSGFHAPSPGQNNAQVLTTNFLQGVSVQVGTYPVTSAAAQYFGAKSLKPEYSSNYGLGLVFNPSPDFTLTADWYSIRVRDRIFISKAFVVQAADIVALPELAGVGLLGNVQYFTNALRTRTNGLDLVSTYHTQAGGGRLNLTLAFNYNQSKVTGFGAALITPDQVIDAERLAPNHRVNVQANWSRGKWTIGAVEHYYGSWRDDNDYPGQLFGAKYVHDVDATYAVSSRYSLTIGGNNIFNVYPDMIANSKDNPIYPLTGGTSDGQIYPRNGGPFGFNGGFWYARVRLKY